MLVRHSSPDSSRLGFGAVLAPDAPKLVRRVLGDDPLDVAHVALVERGGLAVLEDHVLCVLFGGEAEPGEDLERGAGDAALVCARVLEEDDIALFEEKTRLLREEQVGALDNVLEVRLALGVDERGDVGDVDSFRPEVELSVVG